MKNKQNDMYRYDRKKQQFVNEPLKKLYDNEYSGEYDLEDRTLELEKDQINAYTKKDEIDEKCKCKRKTKKDGKNKNC